MSGSVSPRTRGLAASLLAGDLRALARAITLVERDDPEGHAVVAEVFADTGRAEVVGVTGPPGVGKSTLVSALIALERERDRSVGVLSVDPSSPFTRGALLGDRIRLVDHFLDRGVFIRSMANRGALGGMAQAALQAALLLDAAGLELLLLETVGVGQAEVDIVDQADTVVLVLMPGSGDSIQALKAGIMEIPDVIVVNKAQHPLADAMVREIQGTLMLGPARDWTVPVVRTEATTGSGIAELAQQLAAHRAQLERTGELAVRRRRRLRNEVLAIAVQATRRELERSLAADAETQELLRRVGARELDPRSAAEQVLARHAARSAGATPQPNGRAERPTPSVGSAPD